LQEQFDDYFHYTNGELNLPLHMWHVNRSSPLWQTKTCTDKLYDCERGDDYVCTTQNWWWTKYGVSN
jgi:hypothetical protein